ncbi:nuclear transport factor 2 family protein [Henriciella litoralis]|uniref:nuclear transport factor 2 family protein n=1 Tax=Henriciella litoralis TaxID=568102 RepID=UPI001F1CE729|nr:nuclear transport factor 2 family protein [Henriciella litoralis]
MIETTGHSANLQRWMDYFHGDHDAASLSAILHDDVVFTSPVVHTPQRGKAITMMYLGAAGQTLGGDTFRYVRVFDCEDRAVLEFECEMDGILVNGIDMIEWDEDGLITDFKVMVRPLKGMQAVHAAMGRMLEQMKAQKR